MKVWPLLLGAWLVLHGLTALINLNFRYDDEVMAVLALIAGVLVIARR